MRFSFYCRWSGWPYFFISFQEPFKNLTFVQRRHLSMITRTTISPNWEEKVHRKQKICIQVLKLEISSNPQAVVISWDSPWCNYCEQIIGCCNEWKEVPRLIPVEGNGGRSQPSTDKTLDHLSLARQLLGWLRMSRHHTWRKREGKKEHVNLKPAGKTRTTAIICNESQISNFD